MLLENIDGVTILNEYTKSSDLGSSSLIVISFICVILFTSSTIVLIKGKKSKIELIPIILNIVLAIGCSIFGILGVCFLFQKPYEVKYYEVIFDDKVDINELCENYNIEEQRGNIFVLSEKSDNTFYIK